MSKLWMITAREYTSRVKKKTFILTTILAPIGMVIFWAALIFIMASGSEEKKVAVVDPEGVLQLDTQGKLRDGSITYKYPKGDLETVRSEAKDKGYAGILHVPEQELDSLTRTLRVIYYSDEDLGIKSKGNLQSAIQKQARKIKMDQLALSEQRLEQLDTDVQLKTAGLDGTQEEGSDYKAEVATVIGWIIVLLIYAVIFVYGNMVMRSVMEEKTNRIVEVLVSSVKPFELMLGKILGVGAVGLTQFAIWAITFPLLYLGVGLLFADKIQAMQANMDTATTAGAEAQAETIIMAMNGLQSFNFTYIIGMLLIFFLLGYFLYASLFAAVGAAMGDDSGEGQSLTLIVSLPIIIGFYMGISAINNPSSSMAVWSSLVPFFTPIIMPVRIIFEPPMWQVILSIVILFFSAIFFIWLSGRIYRVGILMYGKKTTVKEFVQWIFRKD